MKATQPSRTILLADDDPEDQMLIRDALESSKLVRDIRVVVNGEDLLAYLRRQGRYSDPATSPLPDVILLDLNMPKVDGREALRQLKADPLLRRIPVVILTSSKAEEDICRSYDLGSSSYISKPVSYERLQESMNQLSRYWFGTVELPAHP